MKVIMLTTQEGVGVLGEIVTVEESIACRLQALGVVHIVEMEPHDANMPSARIIAAREKS